MVDPEDVQMHYTAMLCHRALGHREQAAREAALFRRFKADESAQAITAERRRQSPEDNNERQLIHEHDSVRLPFGGAATRATAGTVAAKGPASAGAVATATGTRAAAGAAAATPAAARARAAAAPVTRVAPQPAAVERTRAKKA